MILLQVAILLSFWGGNPDDNWNFYSWIGMGVTIAETIGCHRSLTGTHLSPQDRSLLKRLWWVLAIRDGLSAALIGRPFKVNLDHCDVDVLAATDFEQDLDLSVDLTTQQCYHHSIVYQIWATKLTIILHHIISARSHPSKQLSSTASSLRQRLKEWRSQLPAEMEWSGKSGDNLNIFASTLAIMYNHHLILTYLNNNAAEQTDPINPDSPMTPDAIHEATDMAAQQIALVACGVVTRSEILQAPHELFHGVFVAAVVFYIQAKSSNPTTAQLGISGLTNCKMVLQAIRDTWDPSPWFAQLFDNDPLSIHTPDLHQDTDKARHSPITSISLNLDDAGGVDRMVSAWLTPGHDLWEYHPVLGSLFENETHVSPFLVPYSSFEDDSRPPWL